MTVNSLTIGRLSAIGVAIATLTGAHAQTVPESTAPAGQDLQRVVVAANAADEARRLSTTALTVISAQDLQRFNDSNVTDALRRVPGVTISGSGVARDIRLRGMGNGYTQLLVNGEPVGADFSMDTISPELVERIEIQRSATADTSAQAIAGSINIILKRNLRPGEQSLKSSVSVYDGRPTTKFVHQYGNRSSQITYGLVSTLSVENDDTPDIISIDGVDSQGRALFSRTNRTSQPRSRFALAVAPNLTWRADEDSSLSVEGLLQAYRLNVNSSESQSGISGPGPMFVHDTLGIADRVNLARASANWKSPVGADGKIDVRLSAFQSSKSGSSPMHGYDASGAEILLRDVSSSAQESRLNLAGKYSIGMGSNHELALGWDGSTVKRTEDRKQRESSSYGLAAADLDERSSADVSRIAVFMQDEWQISPGVSAYAGARWEGLSTKVGTADSASATNTTAAWSPVMQIRWQPVQGQDDLIRIGLARTFKSPTAKELIPRRWLETDNSPTAPNYQGNPNLLPELSVGWDVGYEHYLGNAGMVGVNAYSRSITNVVLQQVYLDNGSWISKPVNAGDAKAMGFELEGKAKLRAIWAQFPEIELRGGVTRNVSEIDGMSGPGNRISGQPSLTANLGADYRAQGSNMTIGMGYTFTEQTLSQSAQTQWQLSATKRTLDLFARWQFDKKTRLQFTLSNALHQDAAEMNWYRDGNLSQAQTTVSPGFTTLRVSLDMPL